VGEKKKAAGHLALKGFIISKKKTYRKKRKKVFRGKGKMIFSRKKGDITRGCYICYRGKKIVRGENMFRTKEGEEDERVHSTKKLGGGKRHDLGPDRKKKGASGCGRSHYAEKRKDLCTGEKKRPRSLSERGARQVNRKDRL